MTKQLSEKVLRDWWNDKVRFGMTTSEAVASLYAALDAEDLHIVRITTDIQFKPSN